MATYCYVTNDGDVHERTFKLGTAPDEILVAGAKAVRSIAAEHRNTAHHPGNWPLKDWSLGVNPKQAKQAAMAAARAGVPTDFDARTGAAILRNRSHQKAYRKFRSANNDVPGIVYDDS